MHASSSSPSPVVLGSDLFEPQTKEDDSSSTISNSSQESFVGKLRNKDKSLAHRFLDAKYKVARAKHKLKKRDAQSSKQGSFLEAFCGCGELAFQMALVGMKSIGIDHADNKDKPRCKHLQVDLSSPQGQALFWKLIEDNRVDWVHFGPPCGTASRAREVRLKNKDGTPADIDPLPLRTDEWPDGLPELSGHDKARVVAANLLYDFVAAAIVKLTGRNIKWTVENPTNSLMWKTSFFKLAEAHIAVEKLHFQTCMHGGDRAKKTTFWHHPDLPLHHLSVMCDGKHKHKPWGVTPRGTFRTARERNYPTLLCKRLAAVAQNMFVKRTRVESKPPKQCVTSTSILEPPSTFSRVLRHIQPRRG